MRTSTLAILMTLFSHIFLAAQSGCPGCAVGVPAGLPADTVYLPALPNGVEGADYQEDISFRLPKTTNPVHTIDSTTPPGLTISKFEIVAIDGLPAGLYWQPNKFNFDMANETDGCIRICGTPYESDTFELTVTLRATIFFLAQEATFPMSLYIAPKVSNTVGFSMTDPEGCGETTVTFSNHIPSDGADGFEYVWDFGDGSPTFTGENPPPHTYDQVGMYTVTYRATIDTVGYILESIRVLDADCSDALGLGAPDMYLQIQAPSNGAVIFDSSPHVADISLPYTFPVGLKLGEGNYQLRVMDDDWGIEGSDDNCGSLSFNLLSGDTLIAGGLKVVMHIIHPVEEVTSKDTVLVYPQPTPPTVSAPVGLSACAGATNLVLVSSYGSGNEWLREGSLIAGANDFIYKPMQTGNYQARIISQYGCIATSEPAYVEFFALPQPPVWYNYNNSLRVYDTTALPAQYALQWYNGVNPIPGETGIWYCTMSIGNYGLVVTDLATGCTSSYSNLVQHDPAFDCTVDAQQPTSRLISLFPNPAATMATLSLQAPAEAGQLRLLDFSGRLMYTQALTAGQTIAQIDVEALPAGMYVVELITEGQRQTGKLMVSHRP